MIRYAGYYITFQEVPNEISLVFTISGCPRRCDGCHSPWLRDPEFGNDLEEDLPVLLDKYGEDISCVCFMGEGRDMEALHRCMLTVSDYGLRSALYTGADSVEELPSFINMLDYLKLGHYDKDLGGLDSPFTNQHFYWLRKWRNEPPEMVDITWMFQDRIID